MKCIMEPNGGNGMLVLISLQNIIGLILSGKPGEMDEFLAAR